MGRKVVGKQSFLGGEAGQLLEGRSDLAQFQLGALRLENFVVAKSGPAIRRPGSRFVKATLNDKPATLIDYVISFDSGADVYVVEVSLASATTLAFRVIRVSDNTEFTPTGSPITIKPDVLGMSAAELNQIQYSQIGETLILVHKNFTPLVLRRTASTPTFSVENFVGLTGVSSRAEYQSLPYRDPNISSTTLTASAATVGTGRTITASASFFSSGHVGAYFRHTESATTGYFKVTGFTNDTSVTAEVLVALGGTAGSADWQESAWSTYRGFPRAITFYNQRTVFGGNSHQPDTFWASQASDYFQMFDNATFASPGPSDPLNLTLASTKLNQIRWMIGGKKLTIGTSSSEWVGQFREDGTNLFVEFDEETTHGSAAIQAKKYAYTVPFIQRSQRTIREMTFDFNSDAYAATDLNLFASHIGTPYGRFINTTDVGITRLAFQESPFNILWAIDSVGRLYGLTRDKQQQIASWHSHVIGGKMSEMVLNGLSGPDYPPLVTSICVVPSADGSLDRLWMVVRRDIDGADKYYVEYVDDIKAHPILTAGSTGNVKAHLDCATLATAASTVTWAGYTRFANEEVYVIAEGSSGQIVHAGLLTVSGAGVVTLPTAATKVVVGLHADAEIRLPPVEGGDNPEISLLASKRVDLCAIKMHETYGLRIGKNRTQAKDGNEENTDFEPIPFNATEFPTLPTFTGTKVVPVPTDNDTDGSFALVMEEPWPCTILSLSARVVSNEV